MLGETTESASVVEQKSWLTFFRQSGWLMIATTVVFAAQDGISRHLGEAYPVTGQ